MFNLINKVLSDTDIRILEKELNFAPIQNNEPELRRDFKEFCQSILLKWQFRNKPTPEFSDQPAFSPTSSWNSSTGHPNTEVLLSQNEHEPFQIPYKCLTYSNFSKEKWQAIRSMVEYKSIVIKKTDKGLCVVVWNRLDYLSELKNNLVTKKSIRRSLLMIKYFVI